MKYGEIFIAAVIISVIMLIIVPLSPLVLDFLIVVNISVSLIILLTALYTKETLEFSIFPSLLLITTLFRLGLNISSVRLILGNKGDAGEVIRAFGEFVAQGDLTVGFIIFLIIIIVQFIVITKGSERVAEVAARFTLDAMPGKQMAIDADLSSGLISEGQARERRSKIQREADFYGAMDGASKFVKGDAIVAIIITVINSVGGMIMGTVSGGLPFEQVVQLYTLATIGDGLVSQLPALLISTGMGIMVTKTSSEGSLGDNMSTQLFSQPIVLRVAGGALLLLMLIPPLPKIPLIALSILFFVLSSTMSNKIKVAEGVPDDISQIEEQAQEDRKPENVYSLLQVDPIELEFGYGLIPLADTNQGGDLLDRVVMIRRQCALEVGLILPVVRLRDNIQMRPNEYAIKIRGIEVAKGEVLPDHFLAMNTGESEEDIEGIETVEPAFGMPAKWISKRMRDRAELLGYTVVDVSSVISTHLTEIVKRFGHELLGRQETQSIVETLKETYPSLVNEIVPKAVSVGDLQKVLANLLKEGISIRDMVTILEALGDNSTMTRDTDILTEYVRQRMKRSITKKYFPDSQANVITLEPKIEQLIQENIRQTEHGSYLTVSPDKIQTILISLSQEVARMNGQMLQPIVLTTPIVRLYFKRMCEQMFPDLIVLSYNEIEQYIELQSEGMVSMDG